MSNSYTIYSPTLHKISKLSGLTPDECIDALVLKTAELQQGVPLSKEWFGYCDSILDASKCAVSLYCFWLEQEVMNGKCIHLFMPDGEFCNWIVSCVPELNLKHAEMLQEQMGKTAIVTHFPTGLHIRSAAYLVAKTDTRITNDNAKIVSLPRGSLVVSMSADGKKESAYCVGLTDPERCENVLNVSPESLFHAKLFVGLGMYLGCFPEMLKDGPPSKLKHPSAHAYDITQTIDISPQVMAGHHDSPTAHFRHGHFRLLKSEKFTHKRWQSIFVRDTFVAGKSKTVISPEEE